MRAIKAFFRETRGLWLGAAGIVFFPLVLVAAFAVVVWDMGDDIVFDWEMAKQNIKHERDLV